MSKNFSDDTLVKRVPNTINELKKNQKQQNTDQVYFKGYIRAPSGTSNPTGAPDGAIYYNSSSHELRVKINGTWKVVTVS